MKIKMKITRIKTKTKTQNENENKGIYFGCREIHWLADNENV